ncbi:ABC transporter permease [Nakamurella leprariae]|uniref:ABC transporter permease n=1 Tax=Nakamurella leprariae TaxID=2803911 RepID=A0A939C2D4_9ACTN|nr:ABC transporter permease [Nakamurella leprariae]MBM9468129.1 ABC transporter permease [Nakamurella leprariae]
MNATRRSLRWLAPAAAVVVALLLWQLATAGGLFTRDQFPTMTDTVRALGDAIGTEAYWDSVLSTLQAWFLGLVIASVLAVVIGSALAFNDFAYRSAASVIEIFKAIPAIAILPLVILVLGSTLEMKVFLIAFGVFWPLVIQVIYGVRSMDPTVLDTAKALGVGGLRRFFVVTIPSASPYLATGMRIASASALILAVVSELVGGAAGIGRNILRAQNGGVSAYPVMYAYILTAGLLGIILTGAFFLFERKVMHWHESQRNIRANEQGARK